MVSAIDAFSGQFAASEEAKRMMKELTEDTGIFSQMSDVWRWGAALALLRNVDVDEKISKQKRTTIYAIDTIDPEGIFSAIMLSLFPDISPEERRKKLEDYAEWGIREIHRKYKNGTLNFYKILSQILEESRGV